MSNRKLFAALAVVLVAASGVAVWAYLSAREADQKLAELDRAAAERAEQKQREEQARRERAEREQAERDRALPIAPPPREVDVDGLIAAQVAGKDLWGHHDLPPRRPEKPNEPKLPDLPDPPSPPPIAEAPPKAPVPVKETADTLEKRGQRWTIRFRVSSGRDYVEQLRLLKAGILVPIPPDGKDGYLFSDLNDLTKFRRATDDDFKRLKSKLGFSDTRPQSVADVTAVLKVDPKARLFWVFFPKEVEEELARKETAYRNRRVEDIEQTIFRVTVRGGVAEFVVDEQKAKR